MAFFNPVEPIFRRKQKELDTQDRQGLLEFKLVISNKILFSSIYTRIDQVFVLWGLITVIIFLTAQFLPISWINQAIFWSVLTAIGTIAMTVMTHFWVIVERLRWILYSWMLLMLLGVSITDLAIFLGWGVILMYLCHFWLLLSAIGYFATGLGLRSRAFIVSGTIHLFGIILLPYVIGWQFLATGLVMAANLLLFAETQWDMRLPIDNYALLTEEQKRFNQEQYQLRQASSI